ncbi:MAG: NAD-dependent malic enzyme [Gammaproteobacteria bacterium]|nr:NAD-dependent malic enzyme [Gammaproteobacteria bacterium]MCH9764169.1 NAD-dependent malic enzyme [Gammaproteobacteria bacterium]
MLDFKVCFDKKTGEYFIETAISGKQLLTIPQLNKDTAFTRNERLELGLLGKIPYRVESLDEQAKRAYEQYSSYQTALQKNIFLTNLNNKNQVLFYKLVSRNLLEMIPIIYTPIVGTAVKEFSREYRQPRGLYIPYANEPHIEEILDNRSNPDIDLIVVTDGEGVLGIGDQGIGGVDIPIAKLMVYTLCGGIDPTRTLPIFLDVGTNNQALLDSPFYLGCSHSRIHGEKYDVFIRHFVTAIHKKFPHAFLHWEDFGRRNASQILESFQDKICTFNDDIQGTGAVTLAALLAGCHLTEQPLKKQRIIVYGAGSAGTGISNQIVDAMVQQGLSPAAAHKQFWLVDRQGLLMSDDNTLTEAQKPYARPKSERAKWTYQSSEYPSLTDTVHHIKPTVLIGCSAQTGAFSQDIIQYMAKSCKRPIIFPLSNPDEKCEAKPVDILKWSDGRALIATGTAFPAVEYENRLIEIAQCNNALVFPGIGLGVLVVGAKKLSKTMIRAASHALSTFSPSQKDSFLPLLPSLEQAQSVAKEIAREVATVAIEEGLATKNKTPEKVDQEIEARFWQPRYLPYRKPK